MVSRGAPGTTWSMARSSMKKRCNKMCTGNSNGRGGGLVPRRQTQQDHRAGRQGLDHDLPAQQLPRGYVEERVLHHQPGAVPIAQFQAFDARRPGQGAAQAGQDHLTAAHLAQAPGNEPLSGARIGGQQQGPCQQDREQQVGLAGTEGGDAWSSQERALRALAVGNRQGIEAMRRGLRGSGASPRRCHGAAAAVAAELASLRPVAPATPGTEEVEPRPEQRPRRRSHGHCCAWTKKPLAADLPCPG